MNKELDKFGSYYYRGLLNEQGQMFYDSIMQHFKFSYASEIPLKMMNLESASKDCFAAYTAVKDDHPEMFYLGNELEFSYFSNMEATLHCSILYNASQIERINLQLRKMICKLVRGTAYKTMLEREILVYERIAKKLRYVNNDDVRDHNVVGPLLLSAGVCEGYTALLLLCLRRVGIPCIKVCGKSSSGNGHCWTMAWIDGIPVHLDVTWEQSGNGVVDFNYFNLSDKQISKDHFNFKKKYLPQCRNEQLNYSIAITS